MSYESAFPQWQEWLRRLAEAPAEERRMLERVTRAIEDELRRRLGGAFTSDELADLYDEGTGWATDLAVAVAPEDRRPAGPDRLVVPAASTPGNH